MKSSATISPYAAATAAAILFLANAFVSSSAPFATSVYRAVPADKRIAFLFNRISMKSRKSSSINRRTRDLFTRQLDSRKSRSTAMNVAEEEEKDYVSPMRQRPLPKGGDVAFTNENILRQLRYYNDIRKVGGKHCVQDVYVRDPNTAGDGVRFWFVGKVARCTGTVSAEAAIARQFNIIEEHATRIRPVELGRSFGTLEFYVAPGDTEVLTAQNDPGIRLRKMPRCVEGSENVALLEVGLNLEILTNRGAGFFVVRTEDGVVPPHLIGK